MSAIEDLARKQFEGASNVIAECIGAAPKTVMDILKVIMEALAKSTAQSLSAHQHINELLDQKRSEVSALEQKIAAKQTPLNNMSREIDDAKDKFAHLPGVTSSFVSQFESPKLGQNK